MKLFDKTGREIMVGDVLKVFHFIGARRKRHFMYKWVVGRQTTPSKKDLFDISHLQAGSTEGYRELINGEIRKDIEIVQGYGDDGTPFYDRPRMNQSVAAEDGKGGQDGK